MNKPKGSKPQQTTPPTPAEQELGRSHDFTIALPDGEVGRCWQLAERGVRGSSISAGVVEGAGENTIYARLVSLPLTSATTLEEATQPLMVLLRPSEAGALHSALSEVMFVLSALQEKHKAAQEQQAQEKEGAAS